MSSEGAVQTTVLNRRISPWTSKVSEAAY